jgi:hypothetical protein
MVSREREMTKPLHTIAANEDGIEINIFHNVDNIRFNIVARDIDADQSIAFKIVSGDLNSAIAFAEAMLTASGPITIAV